MPQDFDDSSVFSSDYQSPGAFDDDLVFSADYQAPTPQKSERGDFVSGVYSGANSFMSLMNYSKAAIGALTDNEDWMREGIKTAQGYEEKAASYGVGRVTDWDNVNNASDFIDYFQYGLGTLAPYAAESVVAGGIGGVVGSVAAPGPGTVTGTLGGMVAKQALKETIKRYTKKIVSKKAKKAIEKKIRKNFKEYAAGKILPKNKALVEAAMKSTSAKIGATMGSFAATLPVGQGDVASNMIEKDGTITKESAQLATGLAIPYAALDVLPEFVGISRLLNPAGGGILKRTATGFISQAPIEAITEVAQEEINIRTRAAHDPEFDPMGREAMVQRRESAILGGAGGGVFGGATGLLSKGDGDINAIETDVASNIQKVSKSEFKDVADYNQTIINGIYDSATELTGEPNTVETDKRKPVDPNDPRANQRKMDSIIPEIGQERRGKMVDMDEPLPIGQRIDQLYNEAVKSGGNVNQYIIDGLYGEAGNIVDHGKQQAPTDSQNKQAEINRLEQALGRKLNPDEMTELSAQFPVEQQTDSIIPPMDPADFDRESVETELKGLHAESKRLESEPKGQTVPNFVAGSGGIDWDSAIAQGIDPADMKAGNKKGMPFGKPLFRRGGKSFDQVGELLGEAGIQSVLESMGAGDFEARGHSANAALDLIQSFIQGGEPVYMPADELHAFDLDAQKTNTDGLIEQYERQLAEIDEYDEIQATQGDEAAEDFFYSNRALDLYQEMESSGELTEKDLYEADAPEEAPEPVESDKQDLGPFPGTEKGLPETVKQQSTEGPAEEVWTGTINGQEAEVNTNPTEDQIAAGNYQKAHIDVQGLRISIETPMGVRRQPEWPPSAAHYGYIRDTIGADSETGAAPHEIEQVDIFVLDAETIPDDNPVFIINQHIDGKFDEVKTIAGATNEAQAKKAYLDSYSKGWKGLHSIHELTIDEFKVWLDTGDMKAEYHPVKNNGTELGAFPGTEVDLLGQDVSTEQAEADAKRSVDEKLSSKEDVPMAAGGGDLFSDAGKQVDLEDTIKAEEKADRAAWPPAPEYHTSAETYAGKDASSGEMDSFEIVDDTTDVKVNYYYKKNDLSKGPDAAPYLMHFEYSGKAVDKYSVTREIGYSKFIDSNGIDVNISSNIFNAADNALYNAIDNGRALIGGNIDPNAKAIEKPWTGIVEKEKPTPEAPEIPDTGTTGAQDVVASVKEKFDFMELPSYIADMGAHKQSLYQLDQRKKDAETTAAIEVESHVPGFRGEVKTLEMTIAQIEKHKEHIKKSNALLHKGRDIGQTSQGLISAWVGYNTNVRALHEWADANPGRWQAYLDRQEKISKLKTGDKVRVSYATAIGDERFGSLAVIKRKNKINWSLEYADRVGSKLLEPPSTLRPVDSVEFEGEAAADLSQEKPANLEDNNYSILNGKKISYEVEIEDTGEVVTYTEDAGEAMRKIDDRIDKLMALQDCL